MLIEAMQATSSKERVQELAGKFLRDLESEARSYGVESKDFSDALNEYLPQSEKYGVRILWKLCMFESLSFPKRECSFTNHTTSCQLYLQ